MVLPPDSLRERVLQSISTTPPVHVGGWRGLVARAVGGTLAWCVLALLVLPRRQDWSELPWIYAFGTLLAPLLLSALLAWTVWSRGRYLLGPWLGALLLGVPLVLVVVLGWVSVIQGAGAHTILLQPGQLLRSLPMCGMITLFVGLPPLLLMLYLRRDLTSANPTWLGAGTGAACGLIGFSLSHLHCPIGGAPHALLGHLLPVLLLSLLGALLGRRFL